MWFLHRNMVVILIIHRRGKCKAAVSSLGPFIFYVCVCVCVAAVTLELNILTLQGFFFFLKKKCSPIKQHITIICVPGLRNNISESYRVCNYIT